MVGSGLGLTSSPGSTINSALVKGMQESMAQSISQQYRQTTTYYIKSAGETTAHVDEAKESQLANENKGEIAFENSIMQNFTEALSPASSADDSVKSQQKADASANSSQSLMSNNSNLPGTGSNHDLSNSNSDENSFTNVISLLTSVNTGLSLEGVTVPVQIHIATFPKLKMYRI